MILPASDALPATVVGADVVFEGVVVEVVVLLADVVANSLVAEVVTDEDGLVTSAAATG